jgi:hypothetical protein
VTHAIVLIQAERSALGTLGGELAGIDVVAEAYSRDDLEALFAIGQ